MNFKIGEITDNLLSRFTMFSEDMMKELAGMLIMSLKSSIAVFQIFENFVANMPHNC